MSVWPLNWLALDGKEAGGDLYTSGCEKLPRFDHSITVRHIALQVCPSEIARVTAAGGCVLWGRVQVMPATSCPPVLYLYPALSCLVLTESSPPATLLPQGCLAVSRAFGDRSLQPYVIADPYISCRPIDPDKDSFIYLVSDGVTDMIEDPAGCSVVQVGSAPRVYRPRPHGLPCHLPLNDPSSPPRPPLRMRWRGARAPLRRRRRLSARRTKRDRETTSARLW